MQQVVIFNAQVGGPGTRDDYQGDPTLHFFEHHFRYRHPVFQLVLKKLDWGTVEFTIGLPGRPEVFFGCYPSGVWRVVLEVMPKADPSAILFTFEHYLFRSVEVYLDEVLHVSTAAGRRQLPLFAGEVILWENVEAWITSLVEDLPFEPRVKRGQQVFDYLLLPKEGIYRPPLHLVQIDRQVLQQQLTDHAWGRGDQKTDELLKSQLLKMIARTLYECPETPTSP